MRYWSALSIGNLARCHDDAYNAILGHLLDAAYNVVDHVRLRTAVDLSVSHDGVAIVAGANIALSPIDIANQPTTFEIVCARARVGCFAAIVVLLYRPGSQPLQQQQTFFDELTPVLERVKFDVAFIHCIVSYCDIFCDIVSYRFPLGLYRANTTSYAWSLCVCVLVSCVVWLHVFWCVYGPVCGLNQINMHICNVWKYPYLPVDIILAMMIIWTIRGKIIRTVLCYVVYDSCAQQYAHVSIS